MRFGYPSSSRRAADLRRPPRGPGPGRSLRAPDHGRPFDEDEHEQTRQPDAPYVEVEPSENEPTVAIFGPDGQPLRWFAPRPVGYRSLRGESQ